ncbi:MAG: hypothetical protein V1681_09240 [Candidatus Neomarinimicrobiota bacterium]
MNYFIRQKIFGLLVILSLASVGAAQSDSAATAQPDTLKKLTQNEARLLLMKSAVVPGWGERSLNYVRRSYGFNAAEIALWVTYWAFEWYGQSVAANMKAYAVTHAGIDPAGKDVYYFTDIGNYANIYEYNEQKLRNRSVNLLYPLTGQYYWAWDSEASRKSFDKIRIKSATALQYATFAVGGLVANRIVSMLDIIILTRNRLEKPAFDLESTCRPSDNGLAFSLSLIF